MSSVELGFALSDSTVNKVCFQDNNWSEWDGGKVGGTPNWLHPHANPKDKHICNSCKTPLTFILQIYCPLDTEIDAFHRTLYMFFCRQRACNSTTRFKVFRSQLPRDNPFYTLDSTPSEPLQPHPTDYIPTQSEITNNTSDMLFPHCDIVIDSEHDRNIALDAKELNLLETYQKNRLENNDKNDPLFNDTDIDITQTELKQLLGDDGTPEDEQYVRFLTRIAIAKSQILRYSRWNNTDILWVHSKGIVNDFNIIPSCSNCGSPRKFEFQILPQLLYYLQVDAEHWEWGTLVVFTCVKSCQSPNSCAEEFVFYQAPYSPQTNSQ
ncbi:hypothetical protein ABG067_007397 [Albugo candida]